VCALIRVVRSKPVGSVIGVNEANACFAKEVLAMAQNSMLNDPNSGPQIRKLFNQLVDRARTRLDKGTVATEAETKAGRFGLFSSKKELSTFNDSFKIPEVPGQQGTSDADVTAQASGKLEEDAPHEKLFVARTQDKRQPEDLDAQKTRYVARYDALVDSSLATEADRSTHLHPILARVDQLARTAGYGFGATKGKHGDAELKTPPPAHSDLVQAKGMFDGVNMLLSMATLDVDESQAPAQLEEELDKMRQVRDSLGEIVDQQEALQQARDASDYDFS
jgi:hypothetical protein